MRRKGAERGMVLILAIAMMVLGGVFLATISAVSSREASASAGGLEAAQGAYRARAGLEVYLLTEKTYPAGVPFAGGTFVTTLDPGGVLHAEGSSIGEGFRRARGVESPSLYRPDALLGIGCVTASRPQSENFDLVFTLENLSGADLDVQGISVGWPIGTTAYYETVSTMGLPCELTETLAWDYLTTKGKKRAGSDQLVKFAAPVPLGSGRQAVFELQGFTDVQTGAGNPVPVKQVTFLVSILAGPPGTKKPTLYTPVAIPPP